MTREATNAVLDAHTALMRLSRAGGSEERDAAVAAIRRLNRVMRLGLFAAPAPAEVADWLDARFDADKRLVADLVLQKAIRLAKAHGLSSQDIAMTVNRLARFPAATDASEAVADIALATLAQAGMTRMPLDEAVRARFDRVRARPAEFWSSRNLVRAAHG